MHGQNFSRVDPSFDSTNKTKKVVCPLCDFGFPSWGDSTKMLWFDVEALDLCMVLIAGGNINQCVHNRATTCSSAA